MAYNICDDNGKDIGAGPSINGMRQLRKALAANQEKNFPALSHLLTFGYTTRIDQLGVDCRTLAKRTVDLNVKSSLNSLIQTIGKAHDLVILEA